MSDKVATKFNFKPFIFQDPYASYDVNAQDNDPMPRYDASDENR